MQFSSSLTVIEFTPQINLSKKDSTWLSAAQSQVVVEFWTPLPRCADCHGNPQSRNVLCCLNLCWIEKLPLVNFNIWARYPSYVFEVMCTERVDVSITGGCQSEVWISGRALGARDLVQAASVCTYGQTMAGVSQWNELYFEPWLCRDFCDIWRNYCLWKAVCDCAEKLAFGLEFLLGGEGAICTP